MAKPKSRAFALIREEVLRLVSLVPKGKFTTYGSIAIHMNVMPRHVAYVLGRLTPEEAEGLPWHRVVAAGGCISPNMPAKLAATQKRLLKAEGIRIGPNGQIVDQEAHYHSVGHRREIRWSEM
ncbi:MAG: MGMT family protein [Akkermansiaceae bacterium]|jgi:methylated-DNA-protein-cysteine methyltransferase-like protein|nr:MGMT family protein [Akkermansiaceae bacterium]